jgi:O-antigen/teichoic acid export membrane protein
MVITRLLLPETFGQASMFTLALNIIIIITIFGTDQSFIRFFYEEKPENRAGLLFRSMSIPLSLSIVIVAILFLFYKRISIWLFDEINFSAIVFLAIGVLTQVFFRFSSLVIRMQQKGVLYSNINILHKVLDFVLLIAFYWIYGATYKIIIYSTVISVVVLSIYAILKEKEFWNIKNLTNQNLRHSKTEILKYGSPLVITVLITWLFQSFDKIALRQWSDFTELGLYTAAFKIVALVNVLQVSFSTFWTPVAYEHFEKTPHHKVFYENIYKIISFTIFSIAIISIAGKDILVYLLGNKYTEASNIMPFLVFMPVMYTLSEVTVVGINFFKKTKWHILIALISCIINIIGNAILVPEFGAIGAAGATAFSYIVFFTLRTFISQRYFKVYYNLSKTYLIILLILIYAFFSLINENFYTNIVVGLLLFIILLALYFKDIKKSIIIIRDYKKNK